MNQLKTDLFTQNILIIIHIINDSLKLKKKKYIIWLVHFFYVTKYKNTSRRHVFKIHNRFKISSKESTFAEKYHPLSDPRNYRDHLFRNYFSSYTVYDIQHDWYIYIYLF